jgi:translation initiation factor IF-2
MARKKISQHTPFTGNDDQKLEVVLKSDVVGTVEAISASLSEIHIPGVKIDLIQAGIGNVSKSDVLMARTGSKLVVGFNVSTMPKMEQEIKEFGVEVRLYDTIYKITADIRKIAQSLIAQEPEEKIIGKAKIIATFGSGRKSAIIGCEVLEGTIELGKDFRVITAMGPAYFSKITSLQIERQNVRVGKAGQQVGIKLTDWKKAKVGDLVECFEVIQQKGGGPWKPRSGVFRTRS